MKLSSEEQNDVEVEASHLSRKIAASDGRSDTIAQMPAILGTVSFVVPAVRNHGAIQTKALQVAGFE